MIKTFLIEQDGKIIQQFTAPQPIDQEYSYQRVISKLQKTNNNSKIINTHKYMDDIVYYFSQDNFRFMLITSEDKKVKRIQKYLNTIAELFYEEYDERTFKEVLKYAVEEINKIQGGVQVSQSNFLDQNAILIGTPEGRVRLKKPKRRPLYFTRANIIITCLFIVIVILGCIYFLRL